MKASEFIKEQIKACGHTDPQKIRAYIQYECGINISIEEIKKYLNGKEAK